MKGGSELQSLTPFPADPADRAGPLDPADPLDSPESSGRRVFAIILYVFVHFPGK